MSEEVDAIEFASFFFEYTNEFAANDFTFLFGVNYAGELAEEAFSSVNINEVGVELVAEYFNDVFRFAFAHESMVNVNANEVVANCF